MGDFVRFNSLLTVGDHIVLVDGCPTLKWEFWTIGTPPFEVVFNKDFGYFNYRFLINEGANYLA